MPNRCPDEACLRYTPQGRTRSKEYVPTASHDYFNSTPTASVLLPTMVSTTGGQATLRAPPPRREPSAPPQCCSPHPVMNSTPA